MWEVLIMVASTVIILTSWPTAENGPNWPSEKILFTNVTTQAFIRREVEQYVKLPSGIYQYSSLGSLNETIFLPNGEDMDTWVAPHGIAKTCPYYFSGYDFQERPVWFVDMGRCTSRNFIKEGFEEDFQYFCIQFMHLITKSIRKRNHKFSHVKTATTIFEMKNVTIGYLGNLGTLRYFLEFTREYNNYGLNHTEEFILINMNFSARAAFNALKPLLGAAGRKLKAWGTIKHLWIPRLLRRFPKKYLPPAYGGSKDFSPIEIHGEFFGGST